MSEYPKITINNTNEDFEYWISKKKINPEIQKILSSADIIALPIESKKIDVFPEDILELQDFLKNNHSIQLYPLCNEDNFNTLRQESTLENISVHLSIIANVVTIIGFISGLAAYLKNKFTAKEKKIKLNITIENKKGKSHQIKKIEYEGTSTNLDKILEYLED